MQLVRDDRSWGMSNHDRTTSEYCQKVVAGATLSGRGLDDNKVSCHYATSISSRSLSVMNV